ncbi:family 105 glycoside hydrolase [Xylariaceae sp. FL1019]|nr:family 105 glycoside hydrolase [Xylariaceae sp. FL1019]
MRGFITALWLAAGVAAQTSYLSRMADSQIRHGVDVNADYPTATLYKGFEYAIALTNNQSLIDFYESQMTPLVEDDGTIVGFDYSYYSLDDYRFGMNLLYWYERTGEEKWRLAADGIWQMLQKQPRNNAGGFWHRSPTYPYQMWGDGIFMADSFYAKYTQLFDNSNTTAWDDIANQYKLYFTNCLDTSNNLTRHGYDESKQAVWADPTTGVSPLAWDRAIGWYYTSLLESIPLLPTNHAGYQMLIEYFQTLSEGLLNAQDESGGWWLIMDEEYVGVEGNYIESSATAMFTSGFFQGISLGLLDEETYLAPAKKAYEFMVDEFVEEKGDGTLNWEGTVLVGSLGSNATFEYYVSIATDENDYKGAGPFMWASYFFETL